MLSVYLFIALFMPFQAETSCFHELTEPFERHISSTEYRYKYMAPFSRILFLAAGSPPNEARDVAVHFPDKLIIATDFRTAPTLKIWKPDNKRFLRVRMDNGRPFPFKANSFDLVYLNRGLCECRGKDIPCPALPGFSCGGIGVNAEAIGAFLNEAIRVMDKNDPRSMIYLHGENGLVSEGIVEEWTKAFHSLPEAAILDMDILRYQTEHFPFRALRITLKNNR